MRRLMLAALALAAAAATPGAALARGLSVPLHQTERLQLSGAAASVIVANPKIADVTVVDDRTLYVSGKGYGVTEVVVIDALGRTLYKSQVTVTAPAGQVSIYRGGAVTEMACASTCAETGAAGSKAP